jgi:hypothetical protein
VESGDHKKNGADPKSHKSRDTNTTKMETIENHQNPENSIFLNAGIKKYLLETSKWGRFLAIMGYVSMGLLILLGLVVMLAFPLISRSAPVGFPMLIAGFVYMIMAALYYFPVTYLYKFSVKIKSGLISNDHQPVTLGFENLKSLFKFTGIFTIVIFSLYALIIIIALFVSMISFLLN